MSFTTTVSMGFVCLALAACGSVKKDPGTGGGGPDAGVDAFVGPVCTANQPISCTDTTLTACNGDGTAQVTSACALGCATDKPRCNDVAPSNGLGQYLDMTAAQPDLDLGTTATISTIDGSVQVDGAPVSVKHVAMPQTNGPTVQVFVVKSLVAKDVTITGTNAFALVSAGDIAIAGKFTNSANTNVPGGGRFNDAGCQGKVGVLLSTGGTLVGGSGGGGFGTQGGAGGDATGSPGNASGGGLGTPTGTVELVPLRGGCDGGPFVSGANLFGAGGGAIQLVSRTKISVPLGGVIAANGGNQGAGGSGGGILLEAPEVDVAGNVVANGGGGSGGGILPPTGEAGHLDGTRAAGGPAADPSTCGTGGPGGAGSSIGSPGSSKFVSGGTIVFGGFGGGGVGRIRVNTPPAALHVTGVFSPLPSTGALGTR